MPLPSLKVRSISRKAAVKELSVKRAVETRIRQFVWNAAQDDVAFIGSTNSKHVVAQLVRMRHICDPCALVLSYRLVAWGSMNFRGRSGHAPDCCAFLAW